MATEVNKHLFTDLIKKNVLFRYMTDEAASAFLERAELIQFADGEVIIAQGDVSQFLYCLIKGSVAISVQEQGDNFFIYNLEEGEIFGESALFLTELRIATVTSVGNSLVIRINRKNLIEFISDYAEAGNRIFIMLIYSLLKKLRASTREITAAKKLYLEVQRMKAQMEKILKEL